MRRQHETADQAPWPSLEPDGPGGDLVEDQVVQAKWHDHDRAGPLTNADQRRSRSQPDFRNPTGSRSGIPRRDAPFDRERVEQACVHGELLKSDGPTVPIRTIRLGRDRCDEVLAEWFTIALEAGLDDRGAESENARLPWGVEDELAVVARRSGGTIDIGQVGVHNLVTPIIESRVTSPARASSSNESVPAGRLGTTR